MKHSRIKKGILAMITSVVIPFSAFADDGVTFKVIGTEGNVKEYSLEEIQRLTFQEETFTVMFNSNLGDEIFRYDDVQSIQFGPVSTGLENIRIDDAAGKFAISYDGTILSISGCSDKAQLTVYDISGRPIISQNINGNAAISTESLNSGVYILKINNKTFKFSKL